LSQLTLRLFLGATALLTPDHLGLLGQQLQQILTTQPIQRLVVHHSRRLLVVGGVPVASHSIAGRALIERRTLHVPDVASAVETEFPGSRPIHLAIGHRSVVVTPLLHDGEVLGLQSVQRRVEQRAYTLRQIALVETFADQAVIAIENARLFSELEQRNQELQESHRQVTEALEQQTATASILEVIASSPTDVQPVLDAIVTSAQRLTDASTGVLWRIEGDILRGAAITADQGLNREQLLREERPIEPSVPNGRAALERRTIRVDDMANPGWEVHPETAAAQRRAGFRSLVSAPLLRDEQVIGVLSVTRTEVRPFSDDHVALLETFADQAVIAIENTRLFDELERSNRDLSEALEQQTALAEVLRIIASSPTNLDAVLNTIASSAARLCETDDAEINLIHGDVSVRKAIVGPLVGATGQPTLTRHTMQGLAVLDRKTVHIHDLSAVPEADLRAPASRRFSARTVLCAPMLRDGAPIGPIMMRRLEVRPFSDRQIALLETFADQAVIAIENARLFSELQDRVGELQALGEVGQAVSSSLNLEEVLATIVTNAVRLSGSSGGVIHEYDAEAGVFEIRATTDLDADVVEALRAARPRIGSEGMAGQVGAARVPIQCEDLLDGSIIPTAAGHLMLERGYRSLLAVPILRDEQVLGAVTVARTLAGAFPPETVRLLQTFAAQSALAIQNARLYAALDRQGQALAEAS